MTRKQKELLDFIKSFIDNNGYSPSFDEMMLGTSSYSKSHIHRLVHGLAARGKITLIPHLHRSIEVVKHG